LEVGKHGSSIREIRGRFLVLCCCCHREEREKEAKGRFWSLVYWFHYFTHFHLFNSLSLSIMWANIVVSKPTSFSLFLLMCICEGLLHSVCSIPHTFIQFGIYVT
jgi:hypothetical protein